MATNLLTHSITWAGKENLEAFLKPMFVGTHPLDLGIRVIPNVQSTMKLNFFGTISKVLKAYVKGFNEASGSTFTQKTLTVNNVKAEWAQDAYAFKQTVYETALNKGVDWNKLEGTVLQDIIIELFRNGVGSDVFRQFWLSNKNKETVTTGTYSGVADVDYNIYDGMWKLFFDDAATAPTASQIQLHSITSAAVAQVSTVTLTGTSGTSNITFNGTAYLATFTTSLTVSATNFVTSHAAALLLRDCVVTSSGDDVIFTSNIPGQPFDAVTSANVAGDLDGTVVATTANVAPDALAVDEAKATFQSMWEKSHKALKQLLANNPGLIRMYVTDSMYENYMETLESDGTMAAHFKLIEGQMTLDYRGIKIINEGWDTHLDADFAKATAAGSLPGYPHRAVLTSPFNLALGVDAVSEFGSTEFWYNKDEQENRYRTQFKMGAQFIHNELITLAY